MAFDNVTTVLAIVLPIMLTSFIQWRFSNKHTIQKLIDQAVDYANHESKISALAERQIIYEKKQADHERICLDHKIQESKDRRRDFELLILKIDGIKKP